MAAAISSAAVLPGNRNVSFHNPILPGWHSDPSCVFVAELDNTFFCTTSTFLVYPGCPIYSSKDLIHWKLVSHAINRPSQAPQLATVNTWQQEGIYASTLRYHDGKFWLITSFVSTKGGLGVDLLLFSTPDIYDEAQWSDPVYAGNPKNNIDPDIFWDDDGTAYMAIAAGIYISTLDTSTGAVSDPVATWNGTGERNPEGPHLYKKDGYYYLLIAEAGTEINHTVTIARSKDVYGPYESNPNNPILTNKHTNEYFQTVGHADLFQDSNGNWWGVALSTRSGPEWVNYPMGRETVLYAARWDEGEWPVLNPVRGIESGPLPFGGNNRNVKGVGPWVDAGDVVDFTPGSAIPFHFIHWRTPPNLDVDYVVSPKGHRNTLQLRASRANLTADAGFTPGVEGQTFIARVQSHTLFSYSIDVSFDATAAEQEAGLTVFLTQFQHMDIGVVALPTSHGSSAIAPHIRFRIDQTGKTNATSFEPIVLPVPSSWIGKPIRLQVDAKNDHEYVFSAASTTSPRDIRVLGNASTEIMSGGTGPFTGEFRLLNKRQFSVFRISCC